MNSECGTGKWGIFCERTCAIGCKTSTCDRNTGSCTEALCKYGWHGSQCETAICNNVDCWYSTCIVPGKCLCRPGHEIGSHCYRQALYGEYCLTDVWCEGSAKCVEGKCGSKNHNSREWTTFPGICLVLVIILVITGRRRRAAQAEAAHAAEVAAVNGDAFSDPYVSIVQQQMLSYGQQHGESSQQSVYGPPPAFQHHNEYEGLQQPNQYYAQQPLPPNLPPPPTYEESAAQQGPHVVYNAQTSTAAAAAPAVDSSVEIKT